MNYCSCTDSKYPHTGFGCVPKIEITGAEYYVKQVADDGNPNVIDLENDVIDEAFILAKINHADPSKRWYPVVGLDSPSTVRADNVNDTTSTLGIERFRRLGNLSVSYEVIENGTQLLAEQLNRASCGKWAKFSIDINGNLIAVKDYPESTTARPVRIESGTFVARYIYSTPSDKGSHVTVNYTVDRREKDGNLIVIYPDSTALLLDREGLREALGEVVATTTTTLELDLFFSEGAATNTTFKGLEQANFSIFNKTTDSSVAILGVVESPTIAGRYLLTFAAQTPGDVLVPKVNYAGVSNDAIGKLTAIV